MIQHLFEECVEDKLVGPVFVHDYPASLCPLTKRQRGNPEIAERFELFVHGMELANAYTELNDPDYLQESDCFARSWKGMKAEDSMAVMDVDFVRALQAMVCPRRAAWASASTASSCYLTNAAVDPG